MRDWKIDHKEEMYEVSYTDEDGNRIVWGKYCNERAAEIMIKYLGDADETERV